MKGTNTKSKDEMNEGRRAPMVKSEYLAGMEIIKAQDATAKKDEGTSLGAGSGRGRDVKGQEMDRKWIGRKK